MGIKMITLNEIISHAICRVYMSGIDRDRVRVKETAEVFTPDDLVCEVMEQLLRVNKNMFVDPNTTVLDPSCGDGQFLVWMLVYKLIMGDLDLLYDGEYLDSDITKEFGQALQSLFGVDLMEDNVELTKQRLLCGCEEYRDIVEKNIRCADALTYDFSFE